MVDRFRIRFLLLAGSVHLDLDRTAPLHRLRRNRIRRTMCSPFSVRSVLIVIEANCLSSCSTTYPGEARLSSSVQPPRRQDLTSSRTFRCAALPSSTVLNPSESQVQVRVP